MAAAAKTGMISVVRMARVWAWPVSSTMEIV